MENKKIFVISDVHGFYTEMKSALEKSGFDKNNPDHLLVCCGDYFDRGCENMEVLKYFEKLNHTVLLRGNHEDLLLKLLITGQIHSHNYVNGTMQTLLEFFGRYSINPVDDTIDFSGKTSTVNRVIEFIEDTRNYYETDKYVFVHGWIPAGCTKSEDLIMASDSDWEKARWVKWTEKYTGQPPLEDKILICGHVPTFTANKYNSTRELNCSDIFTGNGLIAIDAGTYDSRRVNVLTLYD